MPVSEQMQTLTAADGFKLQAFRATPQGAIRGGLIVLQEIFGLTDQMKSVVRSYAEDGDDTIFPCVLDRVSPAAVVPFSEPDRGREMAYNLDLTKVSLDTAAAAVPYAARMAHRCSASAWAAAWWCARPRTSNCAGRSRSMARGCRTTSI